jgi:mitochondrial intermembrane space import and assembly protein 40
MQDCFRQYPDVYGAELEDDDDEEMAEGAAPQETAQQPTAHATEGEQAASPAPAKVEDADNRPAKVSDRKPSQEASPDSSTVGNAKAATEQVKSHNEPLSEADEVIPKAWHDSRDASTQKQ